MLDYYLHVASGAVMLIEPHFDPLALSEPAPGVLPAGQPTTALDAMAWFAAEHAVLVAAVCLAADSGRATHAWQLAWTVSTPFLRRGSSDDNARVQRAALDAARRAGDPSGQAHVLHSLAIGYARAGRFDDAYPVLVDALRRFETIADHVGQARVHNTLTWLCEQDQRPADALGHALRALDLYRAAGHAPGQAMVLNDIGFCHALLGDYQQAIVYCEQGLDAVTKIGERNWEAATWDSLGFIYHQLGSFPQSFGCYEHSVRLYHELGDRFNEADTLDHLGDAQRGANDAAAARRTWLRALRIFDEIDHPDGDLVRAKLSHAAARSSTVPAPPGTVR